MTLNDAIASLTGKQVLTVEDALMMRSVVFAEDARIDPSEADALFDLNAVAVNPSREWREFFAEAITDHVVRQQKPDGYVSDAQADWLIGACTRQGRLREDELDALVHILEAADQAPARLAEFILSSLRSLALWRLEHQNRLTAQDIDRLKRLLFATGGAGDIGVTRTEAEALFDINDALDGAAVEGDWRSLFVSAIANCVLFQSTWAPDAARAAHEAEWESDLSINPMKRLMEAKSMGEGLSEGLHALTSWNFDNQTWTDRVDAMVQIQSQAEVVTDEEANWLFDRLGRNGRYDENEKALITFIQHNASRLSPAFTSKLDQLATRS